MYSKNNAVNQIISPTREKTNDPVNFCRRIKLESNITLLYDDMRGLAEGSDGRTYYAICRELSDSGDDLEIIGWSADVTEETIL